MKKLIVALSVVLPLALFANEAHSEGGTDILPRTVNFLIFIAIVYYLLADKLKTFFNDRTKSIQAELDKVQDMLKESEAKVADAKQQLEDAKKVADELVVTAKSDVESIKSKIEASVEQEIEALSKSFDAKTELERKRVKREVVQSVLNQLLSNENIALSSEDLAEVVLKKVA